MRKRVYIYIYDWVTLLCGRNLHNTVNQLYFHFLKRKKKEDQALIQGFTGENLSEKAMVENDEDTQCDHCYERKYGATSLEFGSQATTRGSVCDSVVMNQTSTIRRQVQFLALLSELRIWHSLP